MPRAAAAVTRASAWRLLPERAPPRTRVNAGNLPAPGADKGSSSARGIVPLRRRCGGLLARGHRARRLPTSPGPTPCVGKNRVVAVANAAKLALTVAGAAPASHRTSLSHRGSHASTAAATVASPAPKGCERGLQWAPTRQLNYNRSRNRSGLRRAHFPIILRIREVLKSRRSAMLGRILRCGFLAAALLCCTIWPGKA